MLKIIKYLNTAVSTNTTNVLVYPLVLPRLHYCNSLLVNSKIKLYHA